jgi:cobalt-zinc-cadmium efflux system protein
MRETLSVLMEFTPRGLDLEEVRQHIMELEHVIDVHDLHASTVATGLPVLTAHIVVYDECFTSGHAAEQLKAVQRCVSEHFDVAIHHSTFQIETASIAAQEPALLRHN